MVKIYHFIQFNLTNKRIFFIKIFFLCFVMECERELQKESLLQLCSTNLLGSTDSPEIFEALNRYFLEHKIK